MPFSARGRPYRIQESYANRLRANLRAVEHQEKKVEETMAKKKRK